MRPMKRSEGSISAAGSAPASIAAPGTGSSLDGATGGESVIRLSSGPGCVRAHSPVL